MSIKPDQPPLKTYAEKATGPDSAFTCAVCYLGSETSGLVTPASCSHPICLTCYTKIVILHKEKATCPECRKLYLPKSETVMEDEYADMPPLADSPINYLYNNDIIHHYTYLYRNTNNTNNANDLLAEIFSFLNANPDLTTIDLLESLMHPQNEST
jgi:hypothetical protein